MLFAICDRDPSLFKPEVDILEDYQLVCYLRASWRDYKSYRGRRLPAGY